MKTIHYSSSDPVLPKRRGAVEQDQDGHRAMPEGKVVNGFRIASSYASNSSCP
jgi:hypothetical protein